MRIAIITDIHEDFANLEKAMKAIYNAGYDLLVCLGDITGYSPLFHNHIPDANGCIDLLREKADVAVAGNHDLFTCGRLPSYHQRHNIPENWYQLSLEDKIKLAKNRIWLYTDEVKPDLSPSSVSYLESLKEWEVIENGDAKFLFTHFFSPDLSGIGRWFPFHSLEINDHFRMMKKLACVLSFVGHKHPPSPIRVNKIFWSQPDDEPMKIRRHHKAIICPAIVATRFMSSFVIFDTQSRILETHPVL